MSWYLFLLAVHQIERMEAKSRLRMMDATFYSAAKVQSSNTGQLDAWYHGLMRLAYPKGDRDAD